MMRKTLPEALQAEMDKRGMNQRQAAAEIGTDPANFSRWMGGSEPKKVSEYPGLLKFLHTDQDGLGGMIIEARMRAHAREVGGR